MSSPPPSFTAPGRVPYLGRNRTWTPSNDVTGSLDDLRVFSGALPCNEGARR